MSLQPIPSCSIPSDPDISGIGIRSAIYVQNLLCFIPALLAIWDGEVDERELYTVETQSTSNLILAFAILISAIVQANTFGLTTYHGTIVLSLSWMNNTNAFVYFILYVQHKHSQGGKSTWSEWFDHLKEKIRSFSRSDPSGTFVPGCSLANPSLRLDGRHRVERSQRLIKPRKRYTQLGLVRLKSYQSGN